MSYQIQQSHVYIYNPQSGEKRLIARLQTQETAKRFALAESQLQQKRLLVYTNGNLFIDTENVSNLKTVAA